MIKVVCIIILSIFLDNIYRFCGSSFDAWNAKVLGSELSLLLYFIYIFSEIPEYRINKKCIFALLTIWQALDCITLFFDWQQYKIKYIAYLWAIIAFIWLLFLIFRKYKFDRCPLIKGQVYLCFWYPKKSKSIFLSLFGMPFGSVAVFAFGGLWSFRWGHKKFIYKKILNPESLFKHYVLVNVGYETESIYNVLSSLVGKHARSYKTLWTRNSCVLVLLPFFKILGKDFIPHGIEFIPSVYALKIRRLQNGKKNF